MRNIDLFDEYLSGKLSTEEKKNFEERLLHNLQLAKDFSEHRHFVSLLNAQQNKLQLKNKLKAIHQKAFGKNNIHPLHSNKGFFAKYVKPLGVAASVAIIAVVSTLAILSLGGYLINNQNVYLTELGKKVERLENNDKIIIKQFTKPGKKRVFAPANIEGTGFAINNKGYFVTSLHIVKGADSIFVENSLLEHCSARIVHTDNRLDLAILKLESDSFLKGKDVPLTFKQNPTDLGEKIFTLGYPSDDIVYGEGSISSSSGSGDTAMYQISIPVNPGNSGGPLLDEQGYIIGLIRGKNTKAEGTGFAIKAEYIVKLIKNIDNKELKNELTLSKHNSIKHLKRSEQIKHLQPFIFNVKIYKGN